MKLGVNSVLWGGHPLDAAFRGAALAGYDGIELSAIPGMSEHLVLDHWSDLVGQIQELSAEHELELLAIEQPSQDPDTMERAFAAAEALKIPVVNCGPGGTSGDDASLTASIEHLSVLAARAADHGVTLCVKAHVGKAVYNTPTSERLLAGIDSPAFGLDMDPSHIHRADENPVEALRSVLPRIRHVHIRDCRGRQSGPGRPEDQANGRGDIDLLGYIAALHEAGYDGPVDLEVIGAKDHDLIACQAIASESRGHMQACLQACGAR
jgi:sugar phosphate isomerase/epimerase